MEECDPLSGSFYTFEASKATKAKNQKQVDLDQKRKSSNSKEPKAKQVKKSGGLQISLAQPFKGKGQKVQDE